MLPYPWELEGQVKYKPPCCWEQNLGALLEQTMILTADKFLQTAEILLKFVLQLCGQIEYMEMARETFGKLVTFSIPDRQLEGVL